MADLSSPTTIRWFGENWNSPINSCPEVPTPVGEDCHYCKDAILDGDRGVRMAAFGLEGISEGYINLHLACELENILGPGWRNVLGPEMVKTAERVNG